MGVSSFKFETLRSLAFGSIGASYAAIGTGFEHAASKLWIYNNSNASLYFSFDGTNNHIRLPQNGCWMLDITMDSEQGDYISKHTIIYVKRDGTPTSGTADVSVMYGRNG